MAVPIKGFEVIRQGVHGMTNNTFLPRDPDGLMLAQHWQSSTWMTHPG
jgi:hypothetical protein